MNERRLSLLLLALLSLISLHWVSSTMLVASQTVMSNYPVEFNLLGSTGHDSGSLNALWSDDSTCMVFRSYASQTSSQTLYAHQETATVGSTELSLLKLEGADGYGNSLSASMNSTGRQLLGRFAYSLTGITVIPSSTWTCYYRAWHSDLPEDIAVHSSTLTGLGNWNNPAGALVSDDVYASATVPNAVQRYGYYGFGLPSGATIRTVEVGYEAYTSGDEKLGITLSCDGGTAWATECETPPLETNDPDTISWVDFSNAIDWTAGNLSDSAFLTRMTAVRTGTAMSSVFVDWLPVRVAYVPEPPIARISVDVLIRKSDGTIRHTIATDQANSNALSLSPRTLVGSCLWSSYVVENETDYLEVDYYLDVEKALEGVTGYLRIDDVGLVASNQSRIAGISLPHEYAVEVEFSGPSNTGYWSQLVWTIDSAWSTGGVSVRLQLFNYTLDAYSDGERGCIDYLSSVTSETEELKSQTVTIGPTDFRDSEGNWKVRIRGAKTTTSQFSFKADLVEYEATSVEPPDLAISRVTCSSSNMTSGESVTINVTVLNEGGTTETFNVTVLCNNTQIGRQLVQSLAPSGNTTLVFSWDTAGMPPGVYTINAVAGLALGELDSSDNARAYGPARIRSADSQDASSSFPYALPAGIAIVGAILGAVLMKRRTKLKITGFTYLDEVLGGGIPVGHSVLVLGSAGSGKSVFCQQLAHKYLTEEKAVVFVSYDDLPDKVRKNLGSLGLDVSTYEEKKALTFVDCYSSLAGTRSPERLSVLQPFALTELGIIVSMAWDEMEHKPRALFLDSTTSLFSNLEASRVLGFLQDRSARVKAGNGIFVFTLGRETLASDLTNRLEEAVDCIIELEVHHEEGRSSKRMRIRKLRGQRHLEDWITYSIEPNRGIAFHLRGTK